MFYLRLILREKERRKKMLEGEASTIVFISSTAPVKEENIAKKYKRTLYTRCDYFIINSCKNIALWLYKNASTK